MGGKYKGSSAPKGEKYAFPSMFGSHSSMINEEATKTLNGNAFLCPKCETTQSGFPLQVKRESVAQQDGTTKDEVSLQMERRGCSCGAKFTPNIPVVLKDDIGQYVTESNNIDSSLADPYRCASVELREALLKRTNGKTPLAKLCKELSTNNKKTRPEPLKGDLAECDIFTGNE